MLCRNLKEMLLERRFMMRTVLIRQTSRGTNGAEPWGMSNKEVVSWLESDEGQEWSHSHFSPITELVSVKEEYLKNQIRVYVWYVPAHA